MADDLTLDDKYEALKNSNPLEGKGGELLTKVLLGAAAGGGISHMLADTDAKEDPRVRRKRILRNTLLGTALGAGVTGGLSVGKAYLDKAIPTVGGTPGSSGIIHNLFKNHAGGLALTGAGAGLGAWGDRKATNRAVRILSSALSPSRLVDGSTRKDVLHALNSNTRTGDVLRDVLKNPGGNVSLGKAIDHLGLKSKGFKKVLNKVMRHKRLGLLAGAGAVTPLLMPKVVGGLKDYFMGSDELD